MNSPESYYLHLAGAQQGPYTIPQIDHLLNSGLIGVETLYWCEGLDQWAPVTSLVPLRKKPNPWLKPLIFAGVLLVLSVPGYIFGPVLLEGWHEANQHTFTENAAYWRARDVVRSQLREQGILVEFEDFEQAQVVLQGETGAAVRLPGSVVDPQGHPVAQVWNVPMKFNREDAEWNGVPATATPSPVP